MSEDASVPPSINAVRRPRIDPMLKVILIGLGGGLGSISRYLLSGWLMARTPEAALPLGTLAVNVLGCFAIGVVGAVGELRNLLTPELRIFLSLGFLGGFTTFSSFGYEALLLVRGADLPRAALYVVLQVATGLAAVWLGDTAVRFFQAG